MRTIRILLILLAAIGSAPAFPEKDLNALYEHALKKSDSVKTARLNYERCRLLARRAVSDLLPSLSLGSGLSQSWSSESDYAPSSENGSFSADISFNLKLLDGFSNIYALKNARLELESAEIALRESMQSIFTATAECYLDILYNAETIKYFEEQKAVLETRKKEAEKLIELGLGIASDMLTVDIDLLGNDRELMAAGNAYSKSVLLMTKLTGLNEDSLKGLRDEVTLEEIGKIAGLPQELDYDTLWNNALEKRPDIAKKNIDLTMSRNSVKTSSAIFFPTISAGGGYSVSGENFTADRRGFSARVSLDIPIISNAWKNILNIMINKNGLESKRVELNALLDDAAYEIRACLMNYEESLKGLEISTATLEKSRITLSISKEKYSLGGIKLLDLQQVELNYKNSMNTLLKDKYQLMKNILLLSAAAGYLMDIGGIDEK